MALIPPFFLDCVVAIGKEATDGGIVWVASGFLYGQFTDFDPERPRFGIRLVTSRHVLEEADVVFLRFNPKGAGEARGYPLPLKGDGEFHVHPDPEIDLAIVPIDAALLRDDGSQFDYFRSNEHVVGRDALVEAQFTEGDFCYILGFPMRLVGGERNYVIVRQGVLARVRDYLAGASKEILIDCLVFPGNSGGPVVSKPELVAIDGTQTHLAAALVGIVSGYIPYEDAAVSSQTGRPRVIFEENSGLASVIPAQYLMDLAESVQAPIDAGFIKSEAEGSASEEQ